MHLSIEDKAIYDDKASPYQYCFLALPIELLRAIDTSVYTGEIQKELIKFVPEFTRKSEYAAYEAITKLFTLIVLELEGKHPALELNLRRVLDVMIPNLYNTCLN